MSVLAYLIARLKEPSSYAGLASLLGLLGVSLAPEKFNAIVAAASTLFAAIAVFLPDLNKPQA